MKRTLLVIVVAIMTFGMAFANSFTVSGSWLMDTSGTMSQPIVGSAEVELYGVTLAGVASTESLTGLVGMRVYLSSDDAASTYLAVRAGASWGWDFASVTPDEYVGNVALGWQLPEGLVLELGGVTRTSNLEDFSFAPQISLGVVLY